MDNARRRRVGAQLLGTSAGAPDQIGMSLSQPGGILDRVVTYRRETNQWRDMHPWQRAMMIRDNADVALTACEMQHRRIVGYREPFPDDGPKSATLRGRVDVDFFMIALNRLATEAELAREVADPRSLLPDAIAAFKRRTAGLPLSDMVEPHEHATVAGVRHAFEHSQNLERRSGLGLASGRDGWFISYKGRMFETKDLLAAATELHRAIRASVDPEAFSDPLGYAPFIELRDPAEIVTPWRPGADILARQARAMQDMLERP